MTDSEERVTSVTVGVDTNSVFRPLVGKRNEGMKGRDKINQGFVRKPVTRRRRKFYL